MPGTREALRECAGKLLAALSRPAARVVTVCGRGAPEGWGRVREGLERRGRAAAAPEGTLELPGTEIPAASGSRDFPGAERSWRPDSLGGRGAGGGRGSAALAVGAGGEGAGAGEGPGVPEGSGKFDSPLPAARQRGAGAGREPRRAGGFQGGEALSGARAGRGSSRSRRARGSLLRSFE